MLHQRLSSLAAALATVALAFGMSVAQAKSATGGSLLSAVGSPAGASAGAYVPVTSTYDVSGFESIDGFGSPLNTVITSFLGANVRVTGIGWNLNIETVGLSWLSEAAIGFTSLSQGAGVNLTAAFTDTFSGVGNYNSGGVVDLIGLGLDFRLDTDGQLRLEFFETFDDNFESADALYLRDSTLTIQYQAVPEASVYAMMALGLAGLGCVVRRRRA